MGRTNPDAASHQQRSMILVPIDTPGVTVVRSTGVFGWQDQHGHYDIDDQERHRDHRTARVGLSPAKS